MRTAMICALLILLTRSLTSALPMATGWIMANSKSSADELPQFENLLVQTKVRAAYDKGFAAGRRSTWSE